MNDMNDFRWENGEKIDLTDEEQSELEARQAAKAARLASEGYKYRRADAYGAIADQLDMIYWDKLDDTTVWADHIAAVKAAHPKPE